VSISPDEQTSEALAKGIAQRTQELVDRTRGEDKRSQKLDIFMTKRAKGASEKIFYEIYKAERPVTATELIRRLKIPHRTVYYVLRRLTDEGWLKENVGSVSSWELS